MTYSLASGGNTITAYAKSGDTIRIYQQSNLGKVVIPSATKETVRGLGARSRVLEFTLTLSNSDANIANAYGWLTNNDTVTITTELSSPLNSISAKVEDIQLTLSAGNPNACQMVIRLVEL